MDAFKTQGAFSWNELMTNDAEAALKFYQPLFGWQVQTMEMGMGPYHVIKAGDTSVGGVMKTPPGAPPAPPMWGSYVTVGDVDDICAKAKQLGGQVVHGPMDIPQVGRMAVIVDPQGAAINVIKYLPQQS